MGDWADQFPRDDDEYEDDVVEDADQEWGPNPSGYADEDTEAWLLYPDQMAQAEEGTSDDDLFGFLTRGYVRPRITNLSQRPGAPGQAPGRPGQPSPGGCEPV